MSKDNIIKKITIEIGEVDAELTPKQAKALHEALGELLGLNRPVQQVIERHYDHPRWPWKPYIYYGTTTFSGTSGFPDKYKVTYSDKSGVASLKI
jgi:hypothetical protein